MSIITVYSQSSTDTASHWLVVFMLLNKTVFSLVCEIDDLY